MDSSAVINVGVYQSNPLSYQDEHGAWTGLYPDVMNEIARHEGWTLNYEEVEFSSGLEMVAAGELDMLLAVADSPERRKTLAFNQETFFANWGVLSVPEDSNIQSFTDLDGRTVAVNTGDIYYSGSGGLEETLASLNINAKYVEFDSYATALQAVVDGKADAGMTSRLFAEMNDEDLGLRATVLALRPTRLAIAFPPDAPLTLELIKGVDESLAEMRDDQGSEYQTALNKHVFGVSPRAIPAWVIWVIDALAVGVALVAIFVWYLRAEVRKRTADLSAVTEQLGIVVDAIPDAYIRVDREHRIIEARERPTVPLAFDTVDAIGRPLGEVLPEHLRALFGVLLDDTYARGSARVEYSPFHDDHRREARATLTTNDETLLLIRDISEAHRIEQIEDAHREELERKVAERTVELTMANQRLVGLVDELRTATRARDHFVANVSHEFRTPLNAILGFSSILSQGLAGELNEEQARQIDMILGASKRLAALVEDILALERIGAGVTPLEVTEFDICRLSRDLTAEMAPLIERKQLAVTVECSEESTLITTDSRLLAQILVNLLGNAIKFTDHGGINLCVTVMGDSHVIVTVSDTGIGIPPAQLEAIFEEFAQVTSGDRVKPEGTGLGLAISRRLAELLGGTLTVASIEGEGSTFTLDLPRTYVGSAEQR